MQIISEGAAYQTPKVLNSNPNKAIFTMMLQDSDIINSNRRMYPKKVLSEAIGNCKSLITRRAMFGELDHPLPISNDNAANAQRQTTVSLEGISHIIRDYEFRGNNLYGELETASTPKGNILLGLIKDKAGIGMSMRGMAELKRESDHNVVVSPLTIISFDAVSRPSHVGAVIDFNEMHFESHMLQEQSSMICLNGRCFLPNHFDRLIETKMIKFFDNWV